MRLLLILFLSIFFASCGTDNLKPDNAILLSGPITIKVKINNGDSVLHNGSLIKLSYAIPDSVVAKDGSIVRHIMNASFGVSPRVYQIDTLNNFAYYKESPNFLKGYAGEKFKMQWEVRKGSSSCEDTYVCNDNGVFWISFVPQATLFRFWTADGKEYTIPVTCDFDVQDRHTGMLLRYAPSLADQIAYEQSLGFGHYCFKVIP